MLRKSGSRRVKFVQFVGNVAYYDMVGVIEMITQQIIIMFEVPKDIDF